MKLIKVFLFVCSIIFTANVSSQTVYTTKSGEKFHKSTCGYLKYSKKEITLEKALELNYSACSVCKPLSEVSTSQNPSNFKSTTKTTSKDAAKSSVQCSGKTKAGARCKRITKDSSGRCYQHWVR
ncbi:hypothetical protein VP395_08115 [Mariniflexile soesokkakense]|uniref:Uncharacterized protein n=1 Tax=Mariniflexile soesokkakense TaxID=1343160 RepID=A0ABV0ABD9_9FLAO